MSTENGYIVRLEPGVWLCPEEDGSMGRTLRRKWAAVYPTEGEAQSALAAARRHRAFQGAVVESAGALLCAQCGIREVEEARWDYVVPTCFTCLPPPEPLPIRQIGR